MRSKDVRVAFMKKIDISFGKEYLFIEKIMQ
jgi:hypothetical protein